MRNLRFQPPALQFSALMGLLLACIIFSFVAISGIRSGLPDLNELTLETATPAIIHKYKIIQFISALLTFILPALIFFHLMGRNYLEQAGLNKPMKAAGSFLVVVLLFAAAPFVSMIGVWNQNINWGSMQATADQMDKAHTNIMEIMLRMDGPGDLIINVLLMAVLPAISEELFFRGAMQRTMHRWWKSPVFAIIGSSVFFAVMHGTFSKIIPIFLMGAILGVLYMVTKNLWYCILLHFLFNGIQIVLLYFSQTRQIPGFDPASQEFQFPVWVGTLGGLAVIALFVYLNRAVKLWR